MYRKFMKWDILLISLFVIYLISCKYIHYPKEIRIVVSGTILLVSIIRLMILIYTRKQ